MQLGFRRGTWPRCELRANRAAMLMRSNRLSEPGAYHFKRANDGPTKCDLQPANRTRISTRVPEHLDQEFDDPHPDKEVEPQRQHSPPVKPHDRPGAGGSSACSTLRPSCNVGHMCISSRLRSVIADTLRLRNGDSASAPTIKCASSTEVPLQEVCPGASAGRRSTVLGQLVAS